VEFYDSKMLVLALKGFIYRLDRVFLCSMIGFINSAFYNLIIGLYSVLLMGLETYGELLFYSFLIMKEV
jgi:hypothetical protein